MTLQPGLVCVGTQDDTDFVFSISESITTTVNNGLAQFGTTQQPINILEGQYFNI